MIFEQLNRPGKMTVLEKKYIKNNYRFCLALIYEHHFNNSGRKYTNLAYIGCSYIVETYKFTSFFHFLSKLKKNVY